MIRSKIFAAALVAIVASGTLAADANARKSKGYCRAYAEDVADRRTGAQQVVGGLVGGAIAGGLIGSAFGGKKSVRTGVIVGGATGAVAGGAYANKKWEKVYWRAYNDCRSW
jgi:uncharacterized protein YcfJ